MRTHLTGGEVGFGVSEDIASQDIDGTHDKDDDTGTDHQPPKRETQTLLTRGLLVQVPQQAVTQGDHGHSEHHEAGPSAEERPVARDVRFEQRQFGDDEES